MKVANKYYNIYKDNRNFKDIPGTLLSMFNVESTLPTLDFSLNIPKNNHVVLLFIDCFGFDLYKRVNAEFQKVLGEYSPVIQKISSQFPSTTVAHVTTLNTGMPVYQHGLYEFFMQHPYEKSVFCPFSQKKQDKYSYIKDDAILDNILPSGDYLSLYSKNGIQYNKYIPLENKGNLYDDFYNKETAVQTYKNDFEGLFKIYQNIYDNPEEKMIHYMYFSQIDALSHKYGFQSEIVEKSLILLIEQIKKILIDEVSDVTFLFIADHGQDTANNVTYLNQIDGISSLISTVDNYIPVIGSPRDLFLKTEKKLELKYFLEKNIGSIADIYTLEEFFETGNLGDNIENVRYYGDVLVLPHPGELVFWNLSDKIKAEKIGNHGGMSRMEYEIPFIFFET